MPTVDELLVMPLSKVFLEISQMYGAASLAW
jgi:hypothetical protein